MIPDLYYSIEPGAKAPERASKDASGYNLLIHEKGERVAQLIFARVEHPNLIQVDDVSLIGYDQEGDLDRRVDSDT